MFSYKPPNQTSGATAKAKAAVPRVIRRSSTPDSTMALDVQFISTQGLRDLTPQVFDENGQLRVMPAKFYEGTSNLERAMLGARTGVYGLPTVELVAWLVKYIAGRSAIEVGAGTGILAAALGIPATDNLMQNWPAIKAHYLQLGQSVVPYGKNVENLPAADAVAKYSPQVVIASWVTHLYDPARHEAGGNMYGVAEEEIVQNCDAYVFIGNTHVHRDKPILSIPHETFKFPWLFSRAHNGSAEFIKVWERARL